MTVSQIINCGNLNNFSWTIYDNKWVTVIFDGKVIMDGFVTSNPEVVVAEIIGKSAAVYGVNKKTEKRQPIESECPEGYYAVKSNGASCDGCAFNHDGENCGRAHCSDIDRLDKTSVIFIKK